ncbi:MAG: GHKL domain-containing protein [bacterium]|nr:GHKL domain-containing protein [bacterium]
MQHIGLLILTILQYPVSLAGAWVWERISRYFLTVKPGRLAYTIRLILFWGGMTGPMWIGDENLLFFLPMIILLFLLGYQGTRIARTVIGTVFYLLLAGFGMILDTSYCLLPENVWNFTEATATVIKSVMAVLIYLLIRRLNPDQKALELPNRMWGLCALLSLAPLFAVLSFSVWNSFGRDQMDMAQYRIAYTVLPFVLLSALAILIAMMILSRQWALAQAASLANMREAYYENLRREEMHVRTLRHDLRNHLNTAQGLLERGEIEQAQNYLAELTASPALHSTKRICQNEIANVVLTEKMEIMENNGLTADFLVTLPSQLPVSDTDLCALLGNALDNAIEAGKQAESKTIIVRARADCGMFMLRVENSFADAPDFVDGAFATTKENQSLHGFGIRGMQEIAARYSGTVETRVSDHRFELVTCLPFD